MPGIEGTPGSSGGQPERSGELAPTRADRSREVAKHLGETALKDTVEVSGTDKALDRAVRPADGSTKVPKALGATALEGTSDSDVALDRAVQPADLGGTAPEDAVDISGTDAALDRAIQPADGSFPLEDGDSIQLTPGEAPATRPEGDFQPAPGDALARSERLPEVHSEAEKQVIDGAKADLVGRQEAGDTLGGDPIGRADQWRLQGQNERGYEQDCALASTSAVLRDCGVETSESAIVDQAANEELCDTNHEVAADNGGVKDGEAISQLLTENGVENRIENPQDPQELAQFVEEGKGVITEVDANEVWGTSLDAAPTYYDAEGRSQVNHAVQVTGTVRDNSGELTGFIVNDTGSPDGAGTVVPVEKWHACWTNTNNDHETIVTTRPTDVERASR